MAGTERSLLMLLDHSDRSMFEHAVVIRGSGGLADELARRNVTTFAIPRIGRAAPIALGRLAALLIKLRPHVVHIYGGRLDAAVASALRIPVVERKNIYRNIYYRPMLNSRFADRFLNRFVAASICPSRAVRLHHIERGCNAGTTRVIYNGVEEALPRSPAELARKRREFGVPAGAFVVSFAGRLVPDKGADVLLSALARLPENDFCIIIGDGPCRESCEQKASDLGLGKRAVFCGFRSDVREIFACSDAVAIPSYTESLANVTLEAMAEGKPVVAANVGGMPEAVEHGVTGLLTPPGDVAAFAEALAMLAADTEAATQMGAQAKNRALHRHSPRVMARQTEELYLEVLRPAAREKELECHRITAESAFRKLSS